MPCKARWPLTKPIRKFRAASFLPLWNKCKTSSAIRPKRLALKSVPNWSARPHLLLAVPKMKLTMANFVTVLITIGETPDGTRFVTCANLIKNDNVERVSASLESIRGLNRKELTTLMREHLKAGPPEGSKGAGVGFISIAREANGNWEYDMVPMPDGEFTFFCLEAYF
jgi:hypothetical protein